MINLYYIASASTKISANDSNIPKVDAGTVVTSALNIFYFVSGTAAVIFIIIASLSFTMSHGDAGAVKKAKDSILYSVLGLIVIITAFAITQLITGSLK